MKIGVDSNDGNGCGCAVALLMLVIAAVVELLTSCGYDGRESKMMGIVKVDGHVYLLTHDSSDYWVHDPQCPACKKTNTVVYETE